MNTHQLPYGLSLLVALNAAVFILILIMIGFLLQWPTLLTLIMFPILVTMYVRLARREEHEVAAEFGEVYARYAATTPAFFPHFGHVAPVVAPVIEPTDGGVSDHETT